MLSGGTSNHSFEHMGQGIQEWTNNICAFKKFKKFEVVWSAQGYNSIIENSSLTKMFWKLNSNKPSKRCHLHETNLFFYDQFNVLENAFLEVFQNFYQLYLCIPYDSILILIVSVLLFYLLSTILVIFVSYLKILVLMLLSSGSILM